MRILALVNFDFSWALITMPSWVTATIQSTSRRGKAPPGARETPAVHTDWQSFPPHLFSETHDVAAVAGAHGQLMVIMVRGELSLRSHGSQGPVQMVTRIQQTSKTSRSIYTMYLCPPECLAPLCIALYALRRPCATDKICNSRQPCLIHQTDVGHRST